MDLTEHNQKAIESANWDECIEGQLLRKSALILAQYFADAGIEIIGDVDLISKPAVPKGSVTWCDFDLKASLGFKFTARNPEGVERQYGNYINILDIDFVDTEPLEEGVRPRGLLYEVPKPIIARHSHAGKV